jgi:hypothetical protein
LAARDTHSHHHPDPFVLALDRFDQDERGAKIFDFAPGRRLQNIRRAMP